MNITLIYFLFYFTCSLVSVYSRLSKHFPQDPQIINIVGLFSENQEDEQNTFEIAVKNVNDDERYLAKTKLVSHTRIVDLKNSFKIKNIVCEMINNDSNSITAVFGGNSIEGISLMQSISDKFQFPYFFSSSEVEMFPNSTSFNFFPQIETYSRGIGFIIRDMDWGSFTLIYEKDEDFLLFQDVLMNHEEMSKSQENFESIKLKKIPDKEYDYGPLMKEIYNSKETRIVICSSQEKVIPILRNANDLRLMTEYYAYVILSLDSHSVEFDEFMSTGANITIITMIDTDSFNKETSNYYTEDERVIKLKTTAFLVYDSVYFFAKALSRFLEDQSDAESIEKPIDCNSENPENVLNKGIELINVLRATEMEGITGKMKFNDKGERDFHVLQIIQQSPKKNKKLGSWDPEKNLGYARNISEIVQDEESMFVNKTFIVSSIIGAPYLSICNNTSMSSNNEPCYEGYAKSLIDLLADDLKFSYEIRLAPDGQRGSKENGKWNGIIKELQERRADLGICDMSITAERRKAVDFTKPFMSLGISILYKKKKEEEASLFSFLEPLEWKVWLCVATALLGLSIALFIVSRYSPYDWESSHPCDTEAEELENALSLVNCLWFSLGSVLQQGCDILPKALSSRIVAAMWWFFTLIMVSTYTANLAAFLTNKQMESDIKDVISLSSQSDVKYGCGMGGSTIKFFQTSKDPLYQKMWATMESAKPSVFVQNNDEGVKRVSQDKYAFFMESSTIEYTIERNCELTQVGGLLDNKGYGIAMPLNSPYRTRITASLLKQQENGQLKRIKNQWWDGENVSCNNDNKEDGENALAVSNVGGVFVVLIIGMTLSFILSILEFLWNIRKVAVVEKIPLSKAFKKELHFIMNCHITTKPVRKPSEKTSIDSNDKFRVLIALNNNNNSNSNQNIS